jgi:hypothetical protein
LVSQKDPRFLGGMRKAGSYKLLLYGETSGDVETHGNKK